MEICCKEVTYARAYGDGNAKDVGMLFGQYVIDKTIEEYVTEIGDLASDPRTLIFIDTNVVSYLYKLHEAARREFFAWSDGVAAEGRFFVPAWAANEYLSRVTSNTLASYTPKGKEPTQAKKIAGDAA